jgi:hypothetical protein
LVEKLSTKAKDGLSVKRAAIVLLDRHKKMFFFLFFNIIFFLLFNDVLGLPMAILFIID